MRPLAPSNRALIASQLVLPPHQFICQGFVRHMILSSNNPPPTPLPASRSEEIRHDREQVRDLQSLCNTNCYDRNCCTSRCKARVANLNLVHSSYCANRKLCTRFKVVSSIITEISRRSQLLLLHRAYILSRISTLTRDIDRGIMSVCPSVTFRYCMEMA